VKEQKELSAEECDFSKKTYIFAIRFLLISVVKLAESGFYFLGNM